MKSFKKILASIGMLGVAVPTALSVVACGEAELSTLQKLINNVIDHKDDADQTEFNQAYSDYLAYKVEQFMEWSKTNAVVAPSDSENDLGQAVRNWFGQAVTQDEKANKDFPKFPIGLEADGNKKDLIEVDKINHTFTLPEGHFTIVNAHHDENITSSAKISGTFSYVVKADN